MTGTPVLSVFALYLEVSILSSLDVRSLSTGDPRVDTALSLVNLAWSTNIRDVYVCLVLDNCASRALKGKAGNYCGPRNEGMPIQIQIKNTNHSRRFGAGWVAGGLNEL